MPTAGVDGVLTLCLVATGGRGQDVGIGCRAATAIHAPLGSLDLARQSGPGTIEASGWALDPDAADALTVELTIDGAVAASVTTNVERSDVTRVYPGYPGPRGWTVSVSGVPAGSRRVCAIARDASGDPDQTIGCRTISVGGNPIGYLDRIAPGPTTPLRAVGWALDPDATAPVTVHLYIDGRHLRSATADSTRLDVARVYPGYGTSHGFSVALPALSPGPHTACVFAINQLAGSQNTLLGCRGFTTAGAAPFGNVDTVATVDGRLSMVGWAIDADTVDPIAVHLWADGRYLGAGTANRLRPDVGRVYPAFGPNHGFAIPVDRLSPGTHQVCAYGINAGTVGPNPLLGCRTVRID